MSNDITTTKLSAAKLSGSGSNLFYSSNSGCTITTKTTDVLSTKTTIPITEQRQHQEQQQQHHHHQDQQQTIISRVTTIDSITATTTTTTTATATTAGSFTKFHHISNADKSFIINFPTFSTSKVATKTDLSNSPTPKFANNYHQRNITSSSNSKTRHCTSLPTFHNASELCEIGSRSEMDCMPLRTSTTATGTPPYNHYHHQNHHHHLLNDQTKSLQELQNEVGALLEFRDLVIETFPDLKHKMASMSTTNTLTGMVVASSSSSSLVSRREWEPGIRVKRKITPKENTTNAADIVVSSSSLIRSRSNSHSSGKKEPKSGEGNGSVVQDSGFSTETSSSKEAHSASSTTGAMQQVTVSSNRLPADNDDELLNLLDLIHRKSNRLRDEVEYLQNIERDKYSNNKNLNNSNNNVSSNNNNNKNDSYNNKQHKTFHDHMINDHHHHHNNNDIQILRKERDRLFDKLAEMEAETLAGRIKSAKIQDQYNELCNAKKELEDQLKLALSQKYELNSRLNELQRQYGNCSNTSKNLSNQLESTTTMGNNRYSATEFSNRKMITNSSSSTTFQPVVVDGLSSSSTSSVTPITASATITTTITNNNTDNDNSAFYNLDNKIRNLYKSFHNNNNNSDSNKISSNNNNQLKNDNELIKNLGRLDGLISTPNHRELKIRMTDSKKIAAILLETNVLELQRHLLTLTVQNQVLMQKLEQATKSNVFLLKKLDKSKEENDDIRFQLEEKDIELEGTKAQLRVLESKTPLKLLDFNITDAAATTAAITNRSSSTIILSSSISSRNSPITTKTASTAMATVTSPITQISTPSMKAMIPLAMDDIQHHSSSTESAQDHTEQQNGMDGSVGEGGGAGGGGDLRLSNCSSNHSSSNQHGSGGPETPKRSRPSKIPLPGTKGYLAPKPPTGRSPSSSSASTATFGSNQKSPSSSSTSTVDATVSNQKSLSRSTGSLYGKFGPSSIKRYNNISDMSHHQQQQQQQMSSSSSLYRPDSAQSNTKDNSLTGIGGGTGSRSSTSSIPISSKLTPSPHKLINNSPLPKPKRDSLTSRVRHLDSLSRVHNLYNNSNLSSSTTPTTTMSTAAGTSTPSSSSPANRSHSNSSSSNNFVNNFQNGTSTGTGTSTNTTTTCLFRSQAYNSKKDLSSSSSYSDREQQQRNSNNKQQQTMMSVRRSGSSNSSASIGRSSNVDLQQQQQQQQNETDSGKITRNCHNNKFDNKMILAYNDHNVSDHEAATKATNISPSSSPSSSSSKVNQTEAQSQFKKFNSRNLINEYIAKNYIPPAILRPSSSLLLHHRYGNDSYDKEEEKELAQYDRQQYSQLFYDYTRSQLNNDRHDEFIDDCDGNNVEDRCLNNDDDNDVIIDSSMSRMMQTMTMATAESTASSPNTNNLYQTNKGIEIKYFQHSKQQNPNFSRSLSSSSRMSAKNFHIRNLNLLTKKHQQQQQHQNQKNLENSCKLIGKINPIIAKTWEQLNTFNNTQSNGGSGNGGGRTTLSRSYSNMSDDSEKLFYYHPTIHESKSNFHVNKVVHSEIGDKYESNKIKRDINVNNDLADEDNDNEIVREGKYKIQEDRDDDDDEKCDEENSIELYYDSIDDDEDDDEDEDQDQIYYQNNNNQQLQQRRQQQQHFHQSNDNNILKYYNYKTEDHYINRRDYDDDAAGEEMADEIDDNNSFIERKKYFWSKDYHLL